MSGVRNHILHFRANTSRGHKWLDVACVHFPGVSPYSGLALQLELRNFSISRLLSTSANRKGIYVTSKQLYCSRSVRKNERLWVHLYTERRGDQIHYQSGWIKRYQGPLLRHRSTCVCEGICEQYDLETHPQCWWHPKTK